MERPWLSAYAEDDSGWLRDLTSYPSVIAYEYHRLRKHSATLTAMNNLAFALEKLGLSEEARQCREKLHEIRCATDRSRDILFLPDKG